MASGDRAVTPPAGPAGPPVHPRRRGTGHADLEFAVHRRAAGDIGPDQAGASDDQLPQRGVVDRGPGRPGVVAGREQRLASVDVPQPGQHLLVEQQLAQGVVGWPPGGPAQDLVHVEVGGQHVGTQLPDGAVHLHSAGGQQLDDRSVEAHGEPVAARQHHPGLPGRPPPLLAGRVHVPRAGHPHVGVQHVA